MGIKLLNEEYYNVCCDWCDTENRVLWTKILEGAYCGGCHRELKAEETENQLIYGKISAGLC